jgi:hypothetical protein
MALLGAVKQGTKAALDAGLLSPGIRAYHGSPHDFDRFSTDFGFSGEGAQAYGPGLYFSESKKIAENYRDNLTPRDLKYEKFLAKEYKKAEDASDFERMMVLEDAMSYDTPQDLLEKYSRENVEVFATDPQKMFDTAQDVVEQIKKFNPNLGRLYEVNLNTDAKDLLDWDKPLADQPELLARIDDKYGDHEIVLSQLGVDLRTNPSGMHLANALKMTRGNLKGPPTFLTDIGIKGVKYADAFTRHKSPDKQSKNYVIFDDRLIEISRKYGVTIPVAAAMLQQSNEAEAGFLTTPANLIRLGMLTVESAQNPSAVKSAMTKYDKAMRESKAFRAREKLRSDVENQTQTLDIGERNLLTVDDLVGKVGVPVAGDTSTTGKVIETIGGVNLESPVQVEGGSNFPLRYQDQGYGWASMADAAEKKQGNFALAADETGGMEPVGIFSAMGPVAVNFSTPVAESLLQQVRALPIKKGDLKKFDDELRKKKPNWVGLSHPDAMDQLMGRGEYPQKGAGKLRSLFVDEMQKSRHRDVGFPLPADAHAEILQPELANAPIGSSGFSMFSANPNAPTMPNAPHQSYDTIIPGTYIGGLEQSVPARVMYPDVFAELDKRFNKNGAPLKEQEKTGSLAMDPKLYQPFNEQWAEGVDNYLRQNKQSGAATPAAMAAAGGAGLLGAQAAQQEPTLADYGIGILDAAANAGSAVIAPIANAPHTLIQSLTSSRPTSQIDRASQARLAAMDYQPRTQIGQQLSDEGMRLLGGLLAPAMPIIEPITSLLGQLPRRAQLVGESLLDMSPL